MYTVYGTQHKLIVWVSAVVFGPNYILLLGDTHELFHTVG